MFLTLAQIPTRIVSYMIGCTKSSTPTTKLPSSSVSRFFLHSLLVPSSDLKDGHYYHRWSSWGMASWCLGLIDWSFSLVRFLLPQRKGRFFSGGYGNLLEYHEAMEFIQHQSTSLTRTKNDPTTTTTTTDKKLTDTISRDPTAASTSSKYFFVLEESQIQWKTKTIHKSKQITIQEGRFESPIASHLPTESKYCQFYHVQPVISPSSTDDQQNGPEKNATVVTIILLPATGEQGISERLRMAQRLAQTYGWSSVLVTAPYYKSRRPAHQTSFLLSRVSDIFWQGIGVIWEAGLLATYFFQNSSNDHHHSPNNLQLTTKKNVVCFTGFSFGAAMSCCAAQWTLQILSAFQPPPKKENGKNTVKNRLGVCAYVGSASPNVLPDGLLEAVIDWTALQQQEEQQQQAKNPSYQTTTALPSRREQQQTARETLIQELSKVRLDMMESVILPNNKNNENTSGGDYCRPSPSSWSLVEKFVIKAVNMRHDAFIKPCHALDLERQIQHCFFPAPSGSNRKDHNTNNNNKDENCPLGNNNTNEKNKSFQMHWLPGGHVFAALMRPYWQQQLLVETVQELLQD